MIYDFRASNMSRNLHVPLRKLVGIIKMLKVHGVSDNAQQCVFMYIY